jgi:NleD-like pathogen effector protein (putative zinc metallopeptidase)
VRDQEFVRPNSTSDEKSDDAGGGDPRVKMAMQRRMLQRKAQSDGGEAKEEQPPGYQASMAFGDFWVLPDDYKGPPPKSGQQPIRESELNRAQKVWGELNANSGKIKISEGDLDGKPHPGFKALVLQRLANLLSQPKGRELVSGLVEGGQMVVIRPSRQRHEGGADTEGFGDGKSPEGCSVEMDPDLNDDTLKVFDNSGAEIQEPAFLTLGHELIHARHLAAGKAEWGERPDDSSYGDKEEEQTIADGDLTENDLRAEHDLPSRHGHTGEDTRGE